jgi:hypothetical protein
MARTNNFNAYKETKYDASLKESLNVYRTSSSSLKELKRKNARPSSAKVLQLPVHETFRKFSNSSALKSQHHVQSVQGDDYKQQLEDLKKLHYEQQKVLTQILQQQ